MGTRAVYTFIDDNHKFHVYKHWDGYPDGALEFIKKAIPLAWEPPRFEAADFAAAFVAANKNGSGDVYLTESHKSHGDLSYRYEISFKDGLYIKAFDRDEGKRIFEGSLEQFAKFAKDRQ